MSDPQITKCELCNGKMKKLISQSTFHLKGSGWYVTDYASKSGGYDGKSASGDSNAVKEPAKEAKGTEGKPKETKGASKEKSNKAKVAD
jgi:predicted nucleic acid-binding Zn ribbon protein